MNYEVYQIIKATHICFVIFWMAGMLYMPRLFVYHLTFDFGTQGYELFTKMEHRLMRYIINPAMIVSFITGFIMFRELGYFKAPKWMHYKILALIFMFAFHVFLSRCRKNFKCNKNIFSSKFYRIINEVPSLLVLIIVFLVVLKR